MPSFRPVSYALWHLKRPSGKKKGKEGKKS
jgi:hypothetical protein